MIIPIILNTSKGEYVTLLNLEIKEITCNSDAAQQLPKKVIIFQGKPYTYHRMLDKVFTFRERDIICV